VTQSRQRALDPDALIKLNRELAEVQSEIDSAATAQAQQHRRVDTGLLTVAMHEHARAGQAGKVRQALQDFGDDLLQALPRHRTGADRRRAAHPPAGCRACRCRYIHLRFFTPGGRAGATRGFTMEAFSLPSSPQYR